jgi:hypothetical protein
MNVDSNDPIWWPTISSSRVSSYFLVAAFVGVTYDCALTSGQEVELVWRQRWSLMTLMYISVRYLGIFYAGLYMLDSVPTISLTDTECFIMYTVWNWMRVVAFAMLCAIMITRLYAMYQRSRKILIFLIVISLAVNIFDAVVAIITTMHTSGWEFILSGTYNCSIYYPGNILLLNSLVWIVSAVWEVLALCLAVWIAVKHFRELRKHSEGGIMGDCFAVLIKTHMLYFASFVAVSSFQLAINFSPTLSLEQEPGSIINGLVQILEVVQMFVLGPRLILSIREYHAKLVVDSDAATGMTSIAFQERVYVSTSSSV